MLHKAYFRIIYFTCTQVWSKFFVQSYVTSTRHLTSSDSEKCRPSMGWACGQGEGDIEHTHTDFLWINLLRNGHLEELEQDEKAMLWKLVEDIGDDGTDQGS